MKSDQDWGAVWPGPKTFHPSSVPLPLRQGYITTKSTTVPPPNKFANAELMKIPNFLHLTPPVVKKQCEAIKKFCTPWPKELKTDEQCEQHFPIEYVSSDYCHGLPTIRNPLSRIIALRVINSDSFYKLQTVNNVRFGILIHITISMDFQFKLKSLNLDAHARDKFLRLVGERYDRKTDYVTITVDRCPTRKQNLEYAHYLVTALYHESYIVEPWEDQKVEADMEYYDWQNNVSKKIVEGILRWGKSADAPIPSIDEYADSVEKLFNEDETQQNILEYKEQVVKLLGLQK